MNVIECVQGTPEWLAARAGRITASRINDLMATLKSGGEAASRRNYRAQIVCEILTGKPQESGFQSAAMKRGQEMEPLARAAYEVGSGQFMEQVGFVCHPTIDRAGCSPDGLILQDGLLEIKCPESATHLDYLIAKVVPSDYKNQMLFQMAVCEREWCEFVSYDDRMPDHLQIFKIRFMRDEKRIREIEDEVRLFLSEVDAILEKLSRIEVGNANHF